ncbi:hypothetical protein FA15DRAFT_707168 [Coprinopsis marcescibilis]|uniref:Uncharacterized protein n=1 Tax=Coprinopsis marcescibilis TaxID=230819 RepID=A0A5C3KMD7_COPMA|nr:hypothetical protein FA15DRAFT_707168 [Coprinopsis marcescibilis]
MNLKPLQALVYLAFATLSPVALAHERRATVIEGSSDLSARNPSQAQADLDARGFSDSLDDLFERDFSDFDSIYERDFDEDLNLREFTATLNSLGLSVRDLSLNDGELVSRMEEIEELDRRLFGMPGLGRAIKIGYRAAKGIKSAFGTAGGGGGTGKRAGGAVGGGGGRGGRRTHRRGY